MSLDNVLAVAGVARDHFWLLAFGLVLSVALMGVASNFIARLLERLFWISWVGLGIITFVALRMIWDGSNEILNQTAVLAFFYPRLHAPLPSTQNLAQCGWLSGTAPLASARRTAKLEPRIVRQQRAGETAGWSASLRLTTIREVAHMTLSGDLPRMPQHASVISGTSAAASISGNTISATGSSASIATPISANSAAKPRADRRFRFARKAAAGDMRRRNPFRGQPLQPVDCRLPAALAALRRARARP